MDRPVLREILNDFTSTLNWHHYICLKDCLKYLPDIYLIFLKEWFSSEIIMSNLVLTLVFGSISIHLVPEGPKLFFSWSSQRIIKILCQNELLESQLGFVRFSDFTPVIGWFSKCLWKTLQLDRELNSLMLNWSLKTENIDLPKDGESL